MGSTQELALTKELRERVEEEVRIEADRRTARLHSTILTLVSVIGLILTILGGMFLFWGTLQRYGDQGRQSGKRYYGYQSGC